MRSYLIIQAMPFILF